MRSFGLLLALSAALLTGCPNGATDAGLPTDSGALEPDLTCLGVPWPTTAPEPVPIEAAILQGQTFGGLGGADLEIRRRTDDAILATAMAGAGGDVAVAVPSGGIPVDGYAAASEAGYTTLHLHPFRPFVGDEPAIPLVLYTPAQHVDAQQTLYGVTWDPANGYVRVTVVDCMGFPIEGATVAFAPAPDTIFYDPEPGDLVDPARTETSSAGIVSGFNAVVGDLELTAEWEGMLLGSRMVSVAAGVATAVGIQP